MRRLILLSVTMMTGVLLAQTAMSAPSPWTIKVTAQACNVTDPNESKCESDAWVYNKATGEVYLCAGTQHSRGSPPLPNTAAVICQKVLHSVVGGIELEGNGFHVNRWDEVWNFGGRKVGYFTEYVWIAGQTINDLRFCFTVQPLVCSKQVSIGSPIGVTSEGVHEAQPKSNWLHFLQQ